MLRILRHGKDSQRGSLSLEQVLFIAAVGAVAVGVGIFYNNMSGFFQNVAMPNQPNFNPPAAGG